MKIKALLTWLLAMCIVLCSCAHSVVEPVSVDMLMADALKFFEEGNYEEAILLYEEIIKIEPKNTEAKIGLAQTYKYAGQRVAATAIFEELHATETNIEAAYELCQLYILDEQYSKLEAVAKSLWGSERENAEAGALVLFSYAAQGNYEEMTTLIKDEKVSSEIFDAMLSKWNNYSRYYAFAVEKADNSGVGVYFNGNTIYIYIGEYSNGVRNGTGRLIGFNNSYDIYTKYEGEWADDAPNGAGEYYELSIVPEEKETNSTYEVELYLSSTFVDGAATGAVKQIWNMDNGETHIWIYDAELGEHKKTKCNNCGANLLEGWSGVYSWA